jgi:rhodanese-related sulfurtransferase
MAVTLIVVFAVVLSAFVWNKHIRGVREMERHSITAEALHVLLAANQDVLVFDVREPLDFLVDSDIIPGAKRVAPRDVREDPSLIPRDKDVVIYCTCPSDKTSLVILRRALALHFVRIKFLKGGLEAWKLKGYPVEPYEESFHLDTAS